MDSTVIIKLLIITFVSLMSNGAEGRRRTLSKEEDLELERQLKMLNKPPIKTIRTELGDIFDCIDFYKQPAFDHPLLKNHKIQIEPDFDLEEPVNKAASSSFGKVSKTVLQVHSEKCPPGTVPIRRTKKEDLINAKYFSKPYHSNKISPMGGISPMGYHRVWSEVDQTLYGGRGTINLRNPPIAEDQFSAAQMFIQSGPPFELNSIEVGWAVYPKLYADNRTRLFASWTDGHGHGCFNTLCQGFVQVDRSISLGDAFLNTSVHGKHTEQYAVIVMVYKEPKSGDWWLLVGENLTKIGYWPKELFTHLANNATVVKYGGVVGTTPKGTFPPMGSGIFTDDYSETCFISQMQVVVDTTGKLDVFGKADKVRTIRELKASCYDVKFNGVVGDMGATMIFGGHGGSGCF